MIETGIERMTGNPLESVTRILIVLLVKFEAMPPNTPVVIPSIDGSQSPLWTPVVPQEPIAPVRPR